MPSTIASDGEQDRLRWKWWDRFWLRSGLIFAAGGLLMEASRLSLGVPAPIAAAASQACVTGTR